MNNKKLKKLLDEFKRKTDKEIAKGKSGSKGATLPRKKNRNRYDQSVRESYGKRQIQQGNKDYIKRERRIKKYGSVKLPVANKAKRSEINLGKEVQKQAREIAKTGRVSKVRQDEYLGTTRNNNVLNDIRKNNRAALGRDDKNKNYRAELNDFTKGLNKATQLSPNERAGVNIGSALEMSKKGGFNSSSFRKAADNAKYYLDNFDNVEDSKKGQVASFIAYGIGITPESRNVIVNAFNTASPKDKVAIYKSALESSGYTPEVKNMKKVLFGNGLNPTGYEKAIVEDMTGSLNVFERNREMAKDIASLKPTKQMIDEGTKQKKAEKFAKDWAKTHDYSNMDYFIDKYHSGNASVIAGLQDAAGLPLSRVFDTDRKDYLTGGITSPYKGITDDTGFLETGVKMASNIVRSFLNLASLQLKVPLKAVSNIPAFKKSLNDASFKALNLSGNMRELEKNINLRAEYGAKDKSKIVKTAGNVGGVIASVIPAMAVSIADPAAGLSMFGAQAGGNYARSAYDSGASMEDAITYGVMGALAEVGTEKIFPLAGTFGKSLTERMFESTAMNKLRSKFIYDSTIKALERSNFANSTSARILKNTLETGGEATEEMIMEIVDPYLQRGIYDSDAPSVTREEILEAGLYGAAVAAVLHIPMNAVHLAGKASSSIDRMTRDITAKEQRDDAIKILGNMKDLGIIDNEEYENKIDAVETKYNITREEIAEEKGKGTLVSSFNKEEEEKKDSEESYVYRSESDAKNALKKEIEDNPIGTSKTAIFSENDGVGKITATVDGMGINFNREEMPLKEQDIYENKVSRIRNAKNITEKTGYQYNVKEDIIHEAVEYAKSSGIDIVFEDMKKDTRGWFDTKKGVIYVNANSKNPMRSVVAHEMTHAIEGTSAYNDIKSKMEKYYRDSIGIKRKIIESSYAKLLKGKSQEEVKDYVDNELVARFVEDKLFTDTKSMVNALKDNSSNGDKIVSWLNKAIKKTAGGKEQRVIVDIQNKWEKAIVEYKKSPEFEKRIEEKNKQEETNKQKDESAAESVHKYSLNEKTFNYAAESVKDRIKKVKEKNEPLMAELEDQLNSIEDKESKEYEEIESKYKKLDKEIKSEEDKLNKMNAIMKALKSLSKIQGNFNRSRIKNIHQINDFLKKNKDVWQELIDVQDELISKGVFVDFVTKITDTRTIEDKAVQAGLIGLPIEYIDNPNPKNKSKYKFEAFNRRLPQMLLDSMDESTKEDFRKELVQAVERAYKRNEYIGNPIENIDAFIPNVENMSPEERKKAEKKTEKDLKKEKRKLKYIVGQVKLKTIGGSKNLKGVQPALRSAEKTLAALNLNSACPMFSVGNGGCYLDACYLTQMAQSKITGVNLFKSAMYTGEILQMKDSEIENINSTGGLRLNGVGDTIVENKNQIYDVLKHANMRNLNLKIVTKQVSTFKILEDIYKEEEKKKVKDVDIKRIVVQPSLDNLWVPARLDDIFGSGIRGTTAITDVIRKGNLKAASFGYDYLFGRETAIHDGVLYRKYGFSPAQIKKIREEYPHVVFTPRYVVCTPKEIAEIALNKDKYIVNDGKVIQTLMHGKIPEDCVSEFGSKDKNDPGGEVLNFGSARHYVEYDEKKQEGKLVGYNVRYEKVNGKKTKNVIKEIITSKNSPHAKVTKYINENYSKKEQKIIWKNLKKTLCCQTHNEPNEKDFVDACQECEALCACRAGLCGIPSLSDMVLEEIDKQTVSSGNKKYSLDEDKDSLMNMRIKATRETEDIENLKVFDKIQKSNERDKKREIKEASREAADEAAEKATEKERKKQIARDKQNLRVFDRIQKSNERDKNKAVKKASAEAAKQAKETELEKAKKQANKIKEKLNKTSTDLNSYKKEQRSNDKKVAREMQKAAQSIITGVEGINEDTLSELKKLSSQLERNQRKISDETLSDIRDIFSEIIEYVNDPILGNKLRVKSEWLALESSVKETKSYLDKEHETIDKDVIKEIDRIAKALTSLSIKTDSSYAKGINSLVKNVTKTHKVDNEDMLTEFNNIISSIMKKDRYLNTSTIAELANLIKRMDSGTMDKESKAAFDKIKKKITSYKPLLSEDLVSSLLSVKDISERYWKSFDNKQIEEFNSILKKMIKEKNKTDKETIKEFDKLLNSIHKDTDKAIKAAKKEEQQRFRSDRKDWRNEKKQMQNDKNDSIRNAINRFEEILRQRDEYDKEMKMKRKVFFVGDTVSLYDDRGVVLEKRLLENGTHEYDVELINGDRIDNVEERDLQLFVTPDFLFDELSDEEKELWFAEQPQNIDDNEKYEEEIEIEDLLIEDHPVNFFELAYVLDQNGIEINYYDLRKWFMREGIGEPYSKKSVKKKIHFRKLKLTRKGKAYPGYFTFDEKTKDVMTTPKGQEFLILTFIKRGVYNKKKQKIKIPGISTADNIMDDEVVKEMISEMDTIQKANAKEYEWAKELTDKGISYSKDYARNFDAASNFKQKKEMQREKHDENNSKQGKLREKLQNLFVRPFEKAKKGYVNSVRNKLNDLYFKMDKLGIKKGTKESAAVQWYGEGQYQDKNGEIHEYTLEDLKREFPKKWEKIAEASEYFRKVYDDYIDDINAARERIYPRPMEEAIEKIAKLAQRIAVIEAKMTDQKRIKDSLKTKIAAAKNSKNMGEVKDVEKHLKLIDRYEKRLNNAEAKVREYTESIQNYEKAMKNIQDSIDDGEILKNKRVEKRKDYFHHFQEISNNHGFDNIFTLSKNATEIDPRLEGISDDTQPKSKFSSITLHRIENGRYKADAIEGMLSYVQIAEYMIHIDPVIAEFRKHIRGMAEATKNSRNCNKFIQWLVYWTNDLSGKTNFIDRAAQNILSRKIMQTVRRINSRAKSNAVVGNINSAVIQFVNITNIIGQGIKNPISYTKGLTKFMGFIFRNKSSRELIKNSTFFSERYLDDVINQFDEKLIDNIPRLFRWMLTVGDRYTTAYIWFASYSDGVSKGKKDPFEYADDVTRRSVAGRGIGEVPIMQKNNITQIFAPFAVEVNNTWQHYKQIVKGQRGSKLSFANMMVANFMVNCVTDLFFHRRVLWDPIYVCCSWAMETAAAYASGDDEPENLSIKERLRWAGEKLAELMGRQIGNLISIIPFGSTIAYFAIDNDEDRKKLFGNEDPTRYGVGSIPVEWFVDFAKSIREGDDILDDMFKFVTTFVTPFGGKQIERSIKALIEMGYIPQVSAGWKIGIEKRKAGLPAVLTKEGDVKFLLKTFDNDPFEALNCLLFGKYATNVGQKFLGRDYKHYDTLWKNIISAMLGGIPVKEGRPLSKRSSDILKHFVAEGEDPFALFDVLKSLQSADNNIDSRQILLEADIDDEAKVKILLDLITDNKYVESERQKMNSILGIGLTIDDYLKIRNIHSEITKDDSFDSATDRSAAFMERLLDAGFTQEEMGKIANTLPFFQPISGNMDKFNTLVNNGLGEELSIEVMNAISALEPLEGTDQVTSLQKVEAIANLGLSAEDEKKAIIAALDKKVYIKYLSASNFGLNARAWVDFQNAMQEANDNNPNPDKRNSYFDLEEKEVAFSKLNYSNDLKAAMWQIFNQNLYKKDKTAEYKAAKNPYSVSVGIAVVNDCIKRKQAFDAEEGKGGQTVTPSFVNPLNIEINANTLSSPFGYRVHPISGKWKLHTGIDIPAPKGTPIIAVKDGTVVKANGGGGYGNNIMIRLNDGTEVLYAHLLNYNVSIGDSVRMGDKLGEVDSTGSSTGNHLHFETRVNGTPVDPFTIFDFDKDGKLVTPRNTGAKVTSGSGGGGGSSSGSSGSSGSSSGYTWTATSKSKSGGRSGGRRRGGGGGGSSKSYSPGNYRVTAIADSSAPNTSDYMPYSGSGESSYTGGGSGSSYTSSASSSSGGGVSLPKATSISNTRSTAVGRSTASPTYGSKGLTLPTAKDMNRSSSSIAAASTRTKKTGKSKSFWNDNII